MLKDHLLGRILGHPYDGDDVPFTDEERQQVIIVKEQIYRHKVLRVNYTTYDMRREQDSLNPRTHANIMLLAHDDDSGHPYWYARILGVFHAVVRHSRLLNPIVMDFLWIRWYGADPTPRYRSGWASRRLHRVGFVPQIKNDPSASPAFGFLDPAQIIRGAHLVPAFHHGTDENSLPPSATARLEDEGDHDYNYYYVNQ